MSSIHSTLSPGHQSLFAAKAAKGISFDQLATELGRSEVWVASVFYGQAKPDPADINKLAKVLGLEHAELEATMGANWFPERGLGPVVPTDPLIYRLYEIVRVFGYPFKAIIHEKFGDGILSAVSFRSTVEKVHEDGADWVVLTLKGKYLPYSKY